MAGHNTIHWKAAALAICSSLLLSACASTPPPNSDITAADLAVRRAQEVNASEFAALEMRTARDKLQQARSIVDKEDEDNYPKAARLAQEAQVDARLAESKARSARAQQTEQEMQKATEALRQQGQENVQPEPQGTQQ